MPRLVFALAAGVPRFITLLCLVVTILLPRLAFAQSRVAAGGAFTVVVKSDGTVWAFGTNSDGQLGDNTTTPRKSPMQIAGLSNIQAVAAAGGHVLALTTTGAVYSWGDNLRGQVGIGVFTTDRRTPYLLPLSNVIAIAAGEFHSLALTASGDLYGWGENGFGELGNGNATDTHTPAVVMTGVAAIGAGRYHSLAVKPDGSAWAFGRNNVGQLGNATTTTAATTSPVQIVGVTGAVAVYGGDFHSIIRLSDGTLKATGENTAGQLGDTFGADRSTAVQVSSLSGIQHVNVGANHALALKDDGSLWSWGDGANGKLGIGSTTDAHTPTTIGTLSSIQYVGTGANHSIAVDATGVVTTWGLNTGHQLGDGTTTERWTPIALSGAAYAWRVATPTFSPVANTYSVSQSVTITSDTPAATIRFTLTGADPTEADAAYSAPVLVDQSLVLKARAWKSGMPESEVSAAPYVMQAAQPTVSPTATTYTVPKTVSFSSTTPGVSIRYTTDGSTPTESSTLYTAPFLVEHTTTFKIAAFKPGWSASTVRTSTYTMNFGTLSAPAIEPPSGTYTGSVTMTTSTTAPGVVRYTFNSIGGAAGTPSASSTDETPKLFKQSTNVRARSFHPDYTPSVGEVTRSYTIIAHTPVLSAASGNYAPGATVTITAGDANDDTLRMTIDGTDPTSTSPVVASGTSLLLGNFTLKVRAFREHASDSAIAGATYTLTAPLGPGSASAGGSHSMFATPDGRVYAFGENGSGQLGIDSLVDRSTPTLLNTITGVTSLSSGLAHTLARTWDGQVFAWGNNGSGRIGDGNSSGTHKVPYHVGSLSNIVAVAAGDAHSLALTSDGRVFSWGDNANGQLGLGSTTDALLPSEISSLTNIVAIAAGDFHSLALSASRQLYAWGNNANSRLGDGTTAQRTSPVPITLTDVVAIAAGAAHSVALTGSGAVFSWGLGTSGQLGHGATASHPTPYQLSGMHASSIAAGDNHSAALRGDGVLVAWGANASGQVGDGSITPRYAPVVVSGPASVSSLSLGDLHSMVVAPTGELWTWGDFASGRLGDGSTGDRPSPVSVLSGLANWAPAAPTVSAPSQTFSSAQTVTLASSTAGAVIRYNLTGAEPSPTDAEVPVGGAVEIAYSSLLRAKAFVAHRFPGTATRANYELQSAAPTISPSTGTYTTAQSVTLAVSGPPSVIRYTLDGSDPTATSSAYSAPFLVSTFTTVKAKAFPTNGWAASSATSATLTFNYGTLDPASASPAGGVFASQPEVALTSIPGAIIRYTLNGSTPTASSTLYTGAIKIPSAGATLKTIAFHQDWTTSSVRSETYTVDTLAPTIASSRFPAALAGWHNVPTTVSFACADNVGIASCTPPSTFTTEGQGQTVVGTAIDQAGREATTNVTVNIDLTPPEVELTAPTSLSTTTATSITLMGDASDDLSGLSTVTCNGQAATVANGEVNCTVSLTPGINDIVLAARDAAGNSTSAGVRVIRTGISTVLALAPSMQTIAVDEALTLKLTDDFGAGLTGATWTSSDLAIVSVSVDDPPVLTGLAAGIATITATKNGLSAQATVVVATGPITNATTLWASSGLFDAPYILLHANRTDVTVPDMFSFEQGPTGMQPDLTGLIVRGVTARGDVQWLAQSPGYPLMADSFGAIVAGTAPQPSSANYWGGSGNGYGALVRFAGPIDAAPWRYDSMERIERPAQAVDGTIYAIEKYDTGLTDIHGTHIIETHVIVLDGATGQLRAKIPLQREIQGHGCGNDGWTFAPRTLGPIVGNDGYGYLLVRNVTKIRSGGCAMTMNMSQDIGVKLLRISPTGAASYTVLYERHCDHPFTLGTFTLCDKEPNLGQLLPDGVGGILATYAYFVDRHPDGNGVMTDFFAARRARITPDGIQYDIPSDGSTVKMTDRNGRAFVNDATSTRVVDVTNWSNLASLPNPALVPVATLADGRFAMHDLAAGTLREFAVDGTLLQSVPFGGGHQSAFGVFAKVTNPVSSAPVITATISTPIDEATGSFQAGDAAGTGQNAPREREFANREVAALLALEFIYPTAANLNWEYGGLICKRGTRFVWSMLFTSESQSEVLIPDNLCQSDIMAARFHTHPPRENPEPETGDFAKANLYLNIPNYLMAPIRGSYLPNIEWPTRQHFFKYWKTADRTSDQNLCERQTLTTWSAFVPGSGANCNTPIP